MVNKKKEELVFNPNAKTQYIGILISGHLYIEKNLPCGKVVPIFFKKSGEVFGEVALFSSTQTYPCNITAKRPSEIILISKENILKLLLSDILVMNNFLQLIANKALFLNLKTELLSYSSIQQKICYSLLNEFDAKENEIITLPFSKKTWAESLNVSRPSLYRELKALENYNLLKCIDNNKIGIINAEGLANLIMSK